MMKGQAIPRVSSCSVVDTPIGRILISASDAGVTAVSFVDGKTTPPLEQNDDCLAEAASRQITEYFEGKRRVFTIPIDLEHLSDFTAKVLQTVRFVPFGQTVTYGEIAQRINRPGAARAVGQALAKNPLPLIIPCHRVIQKSGAAGGYTWQDRGSATSGIWIKLWLLDWESHARFRQGSARENRLPKPGNPLPR